MVMEQPPILPDHHADAAKRDFPERDAQTVPLMAVLVAGGMLVAAAFTVVTVVIAAVVTVFR